MSSRIETQCPHCKSPCQVTERDLGAPVKCAKCGRMFFVQLGAPAASLPETAAASCRLEIGSASHAGKVRRRNEDSLLVQHLAWSSLDQRHEIALAIVADGMGGHEAGDQASSMVVRKVTSALAPLFAGAVSGQFGAPAVSAMGDAIDFAIQEANRDVYRKSQSNPAWKGMGATAAVALVWDGLVFISHVGDCRVYHYHQARLTQITKDQTLVARMVALGTLTPEEALTHPARNEVSQAVGKRFEIEPARHELKLASADWLLVCCDGLYNHIDDQALQQAVAKSAPSAGRLADHLVDLANRSGGTDNCSVVAIRCG